jgi:hypothetical protein
MEGGICLSNRNRKGVIELVVFLGFVYCSTADAQDKRKNQPTPQELTSRLKAQLKAESSKIESAELSRLFTALADPNKKGEFRLSKQQVDRVHELDVLTRDVIRAWLVRDLDAEPPPTLTALAARLSETGNRLRARLIAHAEAIVLEGILAPEQARLLRPATGRKAEPLLAGRNGPYRSDPGIEGCDANYLADLLKDRTNGVERTEPFTIVLGEPGLREAYPDGIEGLDPMRKRLAQRMLPKIVVSKEQTQLAEHLDALTIAVIRAWFTRGLDQIPLPPWDLLAERAGQGGDRARDNLYAHGELILLEGILTPNQAERCVSILWKKVGTTALLDPALASRLRLSGTQRENILFLLDRKSESLYELQDRVRERGPLSPLQPDYQLRLAEIRHEYDGHTKAADELIWNCLTPSQYRAMNRILSQATQPARPTTTKTK